MKKLLYVVLGLIGIITLSTQTVNAEATVTHYPDSNISYTLNSGFATQQLFTGVGTITISDCEEGLTENCDTITLLDRNLGATSTGIGVNAPEESYGFYYQRGNNYGFSTTGIIMTQSTIVDVSNFGPSSYNSGIFILGANKWFNSDNGADTNLWGGGGDVDVNGFDDGNDRYKRQGPCPEGFHVPSRGELRKLLNLYIKIYNNAENQNITINNGDAVTDNGFFTNFMNDFFLPYAGGRIRQDSSITGTGDFFLSWSSSYSDGNYYPGLYLKRQDNKVTSNAGSSPSFGRSVRCFYDEYDVYTQPVYFTVTFDTNYGDGNISSQSIKSGSYATQPQDPTLNNATFEGWYLDRELSNKFTFSTAITGNITLYAKYLCDEGYYPLNNGQTCFTFDNIYIENPDNPGHGLTVMDRNLGATSNDVNSTNSYGYYYQWGNNYGFDRWGYLDYRISIYGTTQKPSRNEKYDHKGYYGTKMVQSNTGIFDYWQDNIKHNALRGGENDNEQNNRGYELNNYEERQGPCPVGYHVPSVGEWGMLMKFYRDNFAEDVTLSGNQPIFNVNNLDFLNGFVDYFKLPTNSRVYGDALVYDIWVHQQMAWYWSSSPYVDIEGDSNANLARSSFLGFNKNTSGIAAYKATNGDGVRGNAFPIRCFKNLEKFTVTFDTKGGGEIDPQVIKSGYMVQEPPQPEKEGYTFDYRYVEGAEDDEFDFSSPITSDITLCAHWTKIKKPGWSGGGGGNNSNKNTTNNNDKNSSTESKNDTNTDQPINPSDSTEKEQTITPSTAQDDEPQYDTQKYSQEFQQAYKFAKENGITTINTIEEADIDGNLTRIAMAKMLSYYAINVLGMKPDESRVNKFNDVTDQLNEEYNNGIALAYQLGIMGINMPNNEFRPFDLVPRSEFVTALSRMAYGTSDGEYESTPNYYIPHMTILKEKGIVTNNDPYIQELRGYVMIMLMRTNILK